MTALTTTIMMTTMVSHRQDDNYDGGVDNDFDAEAAAGGDPKRVNQTRTEVCNSRGPGNGFGTERSTHPRVAKSGGGKIQATDFGTRKSKHRGAKSRQRILELGKGQKSGGQNPGNRFGTQKSKIGRGKIRATDLELRNPKSGGAKSGRRIWNSEIQNREGQNPGDGFGTQTQALFMEFLKTFPIWYFFQKILGAGNPERENYLCCGRLSRLCAEISC